MESDAVGVHRGAPWPVGQATVDAVQLLEALSGGALADNREEVAGMKTALAGDDTLLVGREPLDLPRRQKPVGKRVGGTAENRAGDSRPSFRPIEVDDVRELVGERNAQPVIEGELRSGRPHRVDHDRVARQRCRVAVPQFGLVGENDAGQSGRADAEARPEEVPGLFGDRAQTLREAPFSLVKVDDEMFGSQLAEPKGRIEQAGGVRGRCRQQNASEQRGDRWTRHVSHARARCRGRAPEGQADRRQ